MSQESALADTTESQWKTFANRFSDVVQKSNRRWRNKGSIPPAKLLTDDNIMRFFAAQWTYGHNKATVQSSKTYISWALKENRMPAFILPNEGRYRNAFKYYKNLKKDKRWTSYVPNGAESLTQQEVKKIANARVTDRKGRIVKSWVRDKTAAYAMIHMGWHPMDCKRLKLPMVEEKTFECSFTGLIKPALQVNGVATKRPGQTVRNHFSCGCHRQHNPENYNCEYTVVKKLMEELGEERAERSFFWCQNEKGHGWSDVQGPQQKDKISDALQRINTREGVRPGEKLTGDMGRKTFVTLGKNFFMFPEDELKETTHHLSTANFIKYIDPRYVNIGRETIVSRVFQSYEQGHYKPPMSGNMLLAMAANNEKLEKIQRVLCALAVKNGVFGPFLTKLLE